MERRESRASRDYNRGMEEMRKLMEGEMKEREQKLRTAAKIMVLKERETWRSDREQLLEKLSVTEEEITALKSDLQDEKDKNRNREQEIWSLRCQLSSEKEKYDSANALWWRKLHQVLEKAAGGIRKRDDQIISLERSLHAEKESWQQKVSQLEELLSEKEREISRANKKRRERTTAHIDTLALLSETQSALKESQLACNSLEEKLRQQLTEKMEKDQRELSERVESLRKELSERVSKCREELSTVCESWERRSHQWRKEKKQLEETLQAKHEIWIHEEAQMKEQIQCLTNDNLQLQELLIKKEKKKQKSFWSWSRSK
ncbi:golgin subfamily A member 6-like protein 22 [Thunnus albacares]|uniref:golgin subfamily A member 6-like protein 22 n=1 Tax=Thunnus albacares TaxID=8236 RepID=UPI001CF6AE3A|nr:golgin subfamily A member 6-like protein 22 [Thunnus albacares]